MATRFKLQLEIDRTLKRVHEGVSAFEELLSKLRDGVSANTRVKQESNLKRDIKKLQRMRDQLKLWISSGDVRNKTPLQEAKKLIERQMEKYRAYEKESNTKAFSKEGLAAQREEAAKQQEDVEKSETRLWIEDQLKQLNDQTEEMEEKIESLESKKSLKRPQQDYLEFLQNTRDRHAFHIKRLGEWLKLWIAKKITEEEVEDIKDSLEYYVEFNQEPDFVEVEGLYDDILEEDGSPKAEILERIDKPLIHEATSSIIAKPEVSSEPKTSNTKTQTTTTKTPTEEPKKQPEQKAPEPPRDEEQEILNKLIATHLGDKSTRSSNLNTPSSNDAQKTTNNFNALGSQSAIGSQPIGQSRMQQNPIGEPVGRGKAISPLTLLDTSLNNLPESIERPKQQYKPKNPFSTPPYYPKVPSPAFENPNVFAKFDTDLLFFIFYYQQGTYQQYLAAKQLKLQSWRYHKKYLTWFQRHEEPKKITPDYEQGTYVYFDYETGWCQRKKTDFTFHYQFLEDKELS
mmetsp:Transcript_4343/g.4776  ORF Transcript_4343/g.4776 Transcript_4343/m.4776 type:complete len:514 (+) Transcript_4343:119-1660(+)